MTWQFDIVVLSLIIICAVAAISIRNLIGGAIAFGAYSFLMCLLWTEMGAVDVAFTEATVGAGVTTILFFAVVYRSDRWGKLVRARGENLYKVLGLLSSLVLGGLLLYATTDFPAWGDPQAPAATHVSPHYLLHTIAETSVPNAVTSVLADYRGFDTMFETAVILTAGLAVLIILRLGGLHESASPPQRVGALSKQYEGDIIIRFVARVIFPFLLLFAFYVVGHGHHSPGGGFQGGVILGATFILLAISYDLKIVMRSFPEKIAIIFATAGVLIYSGTGALCMLLGGNFLDYSVLAQIIPGATEITARSHGIMIVEIGVALTVMSIIVIIYTNLVSSGTYDRGL
jgi:multicomponent Na+:H+ antiporter subunit B